MSKPHTLHHAENDWIQNNTESCPGMLIGKTVRFQFRKGCVSKWTYPAESFSWKRKGYDFDVKAALIVEEDEE